MNITGDRAPPRENRTFGGQVGGLGTRRASWKLAVESEMSAFYGRISKTVPTQGRRQGATSRSSVCTESGRGSLTPVRTRTEVIFPKKRRVALQTSREENDSSQQSLQLQRYRPGMDLTSISTSFPVDSKDSENPVEADDLGGDFRGLPHDPLDEHDLYSSQENPQSFYNPVSEKKLISMIQQQQTMLERVLEGQKRLEERQNCFEDQVADLASKAQQPLSATPTSSSEEKRKRVVTRTLSVSVLSSGHMHTF